MIYEIIEQIPCVQYIVHKVEADSRAEAMSKWIGMETDEATEIYHTEHNYSNTIVTVNGELY